MKPLVLLILDGWGYREATKNNAIAQANTPNWDRLWQNHPHTLVDASGETVGLPKGQIGNSEVGHLHIGAGRLAPQQLMNVNQLINNGDFFKSAELRSACERLKVNGKTLHIIGLLSPGGVHSHEDHLLAMVQLAADHDIHNIQLHAILDGRDVLPQSAEPSLSKAQQIFAKLGVGQIASICGRYFAMDRDKRWERTEQAYRLLTEGYAQYKSSDALSALHAAYDRKETDEFIHPTWINGATPIENGDSIIFMNFRSDRARQLSHAFVDDHFQGFDRIKHLPLTHFTTLTTYETNLNAIVAFPTEKLTNTLGEVVANAGKKQLRIAETEKYAHVTYFLNGGIETPFEGEDRELIPSPDVATYDLQPQMHAFDVTDKLVDAIIAQSYDLVVCNFANPDMVGHTGNFQAACQAVETIDSCLGKIINAIQTVSGEVIITADHGNVEDLLDRASGQPHTAHTTNPVPLVYIGRPAELTKNRLHLSDIAPMVLACMGLAQPKEMTGKNYIKWL